MEPANAIFSLPPIVLEKVKLSEIIDLLRSRVNRHYMPKATGEVLYNSKPTYVQQAHHSHRDIPDVHPLEQSGYHCLDFGIEQQPIFFNLHIAQFQIMINLITEKAFIRLNDSKRSRLEPFTEWRLVDEEALPLMRCELRELIDINS
jgi:hypothetical protein